MLKDWEYDPSAERVAVIGVPEEARASSELSIVRAKSSDGCDKEKPAGVLAPYPIE